MGPQATTVYDLDKLEDGVVNQDLATKGREAKTPLSIPCVITNFVAVCHYPDDRATLLKIKKEGYVRKKEVARSWSESSWHFDPMAMRGGAIWLRVVTQPSVIGDGGVAFGRRLKELHLGDCMRGDLTELGPLLCRLSCLELLYLCDNPSLRGDMSKILGSRWVLHALRLSPPSRSPHILVALPACLLPYRPFLLLRSLPRLRRLALQRTAVETKLGLQTLSPCRQLQYVDVTGCKGVKGNIPEGLQRLAGLHLNLAGSGIAGEDKYGNRYRSR